MTDIHIASKGQTSQPQLKVGIYCDFQNVYLSQELANLLLAFANARGRLVSKKVYCNSLFENQASAKENLQRIGFKCEDVTCSLKNSADNQLKSDLIDDVYNNQSPDTVILVSGDGDFANPIQFLQDKGKNVIIFAQRGNVKQKLKERADEFYFMDELPQLIGKKTQPQTAYIEFQINYNEAIKYLIKAINTALSQGKRTRFNYIDNLMRQHCASYQGFSSIHTPDGKKFKSFSQFVDAVVRDGKIQRQNQDLFLMKLDRLAA
ncbi:NYN domain-containing protein [Komarekiella sp. 'clone 1']|uniref:NYN domain-containing protein n=1 Tax=Komarekiella delphini-convector SJRDD-AB1 TaxID=2593771 RepID=A0AA40VQR0_9NOST|nr:NYN domain-containing protein [Komarekiella delphini-convector]MBD6616542.1 NYN domain-containing protein [Komarekiella delphini-convector SJRDD-AB1]